MLARAVKNRCRLPPGRLDPFDREMQSDQHFILKKALDHGPLFKTWWDGRYTTCLVGHARARSLLLANEDTLPGDTIDLRGLFPLGALRAMSGETHRKYRRLFVQAFNAMPPAAHDAAIRDWIRRSINSLIEGRADAAISSQELRSTLRMTTTGIMLRLLFGVAPETPEFAELVDCYRRFGPKAPVYVIEAAQLEAFADIKKRITQIAADIRCNPTAHPPSFLKHLVERDELDETALGNLIYLLESNFDIHSLWRWILKHLASHPRLQERYRDQASRRPDRCRPMAEAIVLETLRLEQSEGCRRIPSTDIVLDGILIPKDTVMRACLWEGHKDPRIFPDPFKFDPDRFIGRTFEIGEFAPFGLDRRRCIAANFVVAVSTTFVELFLTEFALTLVSDGPPRHGAYHWEPSPDLSIIIAPIG